MKSSRVMLLLDSNVAAAAAAAIVATDSVRCDNCQAESVGTRYLEDLTYGTLAANCSLSFWGSIVTWFLLTCNSHQGEGLGFTELRGEDDANELV